MLCAAPEQAIDGLDADVLTIENSRSGDEMLRALAKYGYSRDIGAGVYDVHSPVVPPCAPPYLPSPALLRYCARWPKYGYSRDIGAGVYDVHSPVVPPCAPPYLPSPALLRCYARWPKYGYSRDIGAGVCDVHSPVVPPCTRPSSLLPWRLPRELHLWLTSCAWQLAAERAPLACRRPLCLRMAAHGRHAHVPSPCRRP